MKTILFCLLLVLLTGCSGDDELNKKSKVEQFSDKTTEKVVDSMSVPIEKANQTTEAARQRARRMDQSLQEIK